MGTVSPTPYSPPPPPPDQPHPVAIEAEQAVLGSILIAGNVLPVVERTVRPTDFYRSAHERIYSAMLRLTSRATPIDLVTLGDELERSGELEQIGGPAYLAGLMAGVPTAVHAGHYATIVAHRSIQRALIAAAGRISAIAYEEANDTALALARAKAALDDVINRRQSQRERARDFVLRHR